MYLSIIILPLLGSIVSGFFSRKVRVSSTDSILLNTGSKFGILDRNKFIFRAFSSEADKGNSNLQSVTCLIKEHSDTNLVLIELSNGELLTLTREFIEWFRGFTDAEGSFYIRGAAKGSSFSFSFGIQLHIDDIAALEYIKDNLHIGVIRKDLKDPVASYRVSGLKEIAIVIAIFKKFNLNSTKHLNFLKFEKAFKLYMENISKEDRNTIKPIITNLKEGMNTLQTDFNRPEDHKIVITEGWLLGFSEGDGTFHYVISKESFTYSIGQKNRGALMIAVKNFLESRVTEGSINSVEGGAVKIYPSKSDVLQLTVRDLGFIESVIIPLFDNLAWHTKKKLDYIDWKFMIELRKKGHHHTEEGKDLIARIAGQMNNNRLSTSDVPKVDRTLLLEEIANLLLESNYTLKGGKVWIESLNRFKNDNTRKAVQLLEEYTGKIINTFRTQSDCAEFFNISEAGIRKRLQNKTIFYYEGSRVYLTR